MSILDRFNAVYLENEVNLTKTISDYLGEIEAEFNKRIKTDAFNNRFLKVVKEKYPQYIWTIEGSGCCSLVLGGYNIPRSEIPKVRESLHILKDVENPNYEFDLGFYLRDEETTKEYYSKVLEVNSK